MPAITLGVAEIETRLRLVRRRWNGVTVQHAVYIGGSIVALAAALLIVLALRGSTPLFGVIFWAAIGVTLVGVAATALRVRRTWLSAERTARRIDHAARLDDRLSTLVGCAARLDRSPVGGILVRQLLDLGPRWTPAQIAPRRVARSVWLLVASLCALLATSLLERRPPAPSPLATRRLSSSVAEGGQRLASAKGLEGAAEKVAAPSTTMGGDEEADALSAAPAGRRDGGGSRGDHGAASESRGEDLADKPGMPDAGAIAAQSERTQGGKGQPGDGVPERLQEMIREAFGAKMLEAPRQVAKATSSDRERGQAPQAQAKAPNAEHASGAESHETGQQSIASAKAGRPGERSQQPSRDQTGQEGTQQGGSAPRAGGGAGAAGTLFGAQASAEHANGAPRTFQVKLSSFGNSFRMDTEPQTKKGAENVPTVAAKSGPTEDPSVSLNQSADDPLQKGAIPPEHEATVRQIFSFRE